MTTRDDQQGIMRTRIIALVIAVAGALAVPTGAAAGTPDEAAGEGASDAPVSAADTLSGDLHSYGEMVDYPMLFPVVDGASYTYFWDTFWASRSHGDHHAQDIMAPKMTPIIAPVDGTIGFVNWSHDPNQPNWDRCCNLTLDHDDGWSTWYIHLNNDTPGTDDGRAWGIAPGIVQGVHVQAGQLLGWVGDSGNAENTGPHLHFELRDPEGTIVNPYQALLDATHVDWSLKCLGRHVTIRGTTGDDVIVGTEGDDVIHGLAGDDVIDGLGGNDRICGGAGADTIDGGEGHDRIKGHGDADILIGGLGNDRMLGGGNNDIIEGGPGNDRMLGNKGNDTIVGDSGNDTLIGGGGWDTLDPGDGTDRASGGAKNDRFIASPGTNLLQGGTGVDTVDYHGLEVGVAVDLLLGIASGFGEDTLQGIEAILGTQAADVLIGNDEANVLRGHDGDDLLNGGGGDDTLNGGPGNDEIDGGDGTDTCTWGTVMVGCEPVPA